MSTLTIRDSRAISLLTGVFFLSGFSSLIYQVVWQRILTLHYGVGAISIALIVSIYMAGLGVGGLLGGLLAERVKNKTALYFIVELLIGLFGLISLPFLDLLGRHTAGSSYSISLIYMFLFLCLPTLLMGITLPLLTKIFNGIVQNFLETVSFLYFINTIGAAIGAGFTSYVLISFFGLDTAVYFAAAVNFILAAVIFLVQWLWLEEEAKLASVELGNEGEPTLGRAAYLVVFVTGFLAIGYEIVWFRVAGVLVKDSPYAFSTILSVYLTGVALGSFCMSRYLKRHYKTDKRAAFFILQGLIGLYVIITFTSYYYATKYTYLDVFTRLSFSTVLHPSPVRISDFLTLSGSLISLYAVIDVLLWPIIFILVPTLLMGASFPLISYLALLRHNEEGKTIGTVVFFSILGNVLGGILTGFLLLRYLGTETTLLAFSGVNVGMFLFVSQFAGNRLSVARRTVFVAVVIAASALLLPRSGQLYDAMHSSPGHRYVRFFEEGVDGIIMTYHNGERVVNYINGLNHGGRPDGKYYFETLEALNLAPKVDDVLIIGYGAGSIVEAVLKTQEVKKVTVIELSHALIKNLKKIAFYRDMMGNRRLSLIMEDGRRFLLRTAEKYDLILMDPLRATTAYANNLHSREFFELAQRRLNPAGVILVGGLNERRVLPKTIASVFPHVRLYDYFCLASQTQFTKNQERYSRLLAQFSEEMQRSILLNEKSYLGDETYVATVTKGYPINHEWKPVSEYYLGLQLRKKLFRFGFNEATL